MGHVVKGFTDSAVLVCSLSLIVPVRTWPGWYFKFVLKFRQCYKIERYSTKSHWNPVIREKSSGDESKTVSTNFGIQCLLIRHQWFKNEMIDEVLRDCRSDEHNLDLKSLPLRPVFYVFSSLISEFTLLMWLPSWPLSKNVSSLSDSTGK